MNTIDKLQYDLSQWYESSSIGRFIRWWTGELKSFVPKNYQDKIFHQAVKVYLIPKDELIEVWLDKGDGVEKYVTEEELQNLDGEQWWHQVQHISTQADGKDVEIYFLLSGDEVLVRKATWPQAAKDNLDDVIQYELDKFVPFKADQVYISHKIDKHNSDETKVFVDLAVAPKERISKIMELCEDKSISLNGVDVNISNPQGVPASLGINLLPLENRKTRNLFNLKLNIGLMVILVALIYFIMQTSIANKQKKIDTLTEVNSKLQQNARISKQLRKELKDTIVSSRFLQNKKKETPQLMTVLSEVTSVFPEHTYITRFKISGDSLEIVGQSNNANSLIAKLDASPNIFVPQLVSTTPDPRTGKEKFTIKAELKEPPAEEENGN